MESDVTYGLLTGGWPPAGERRTRVSDEATNDDRDGRPPGREWVERVSVSLPVIAWAPQFVNTALRGTARYVSTGGLMLEFPVEVVRGSTLRVVFETRHGPLEVEGGIVWTSFNRGVFHHGLVFTEPKGPDFPDRVAGERY